MTMKKNTAWPDHSPMSKKAAATRRDEDADNASLTTLSLEFREK
jgi:hypothetical protein